MFQLVAHHRKTVHGWYLKPMRSWNKPISHKYLSHFTDFSHDFFRMSFRKLPTSGKWRVSCYALRKRTRS